MSDLPERLRALADATQGLEWELPVTAREDCLRAAEEIEQLRAHVSDLLYVLDHIADPIQRFKREAEESGGEKVVDSYWANQIANNALYLRGYAKETLRRFEEQSGVGDGL